MPCDSKHRAYPINTLIIKNNGATQKVTPFFNWTVNYR